MHGVTCGPVKTAWRAPSSRTPVTHHAEVLFTEVLGGEHRDLPALTTTWGPVCGQGREEAPAGSRREAPEHTGASAWEQRRPRCPESGHHSGTGGGRREEPGAEGHT